MTDFRVFVILCLTQGLLIASTSHSARAIEQPASNEQLEFFEKEVRPILAEHCYQCHSVKAERIEGSLYLDSRAAHLRGGDSGEAIVPGDADGSLLIEAVRYDSFEMPPKGKLPDRDIDVLVRWVNMGAPWPKEEAPVAEGSRNEFDLQKRKSEFWVWQPIDAEDPPTVKNNAWPRNDLDRHVLSDLEKAGLSPASDADRTALLRRLYFDLIGLPPTPQEVATFLADRDSKAVSEVVDNLLQSEHFGERWGRHWLDLVRYAESRGHEFDNDTPNAFQYRDYVIRALNADVPYDQFVREHIAGDLLPNPRLHPTQKFNESVLGTGFWFLGEWVHSPVDIRKDEADRFDNMLDVMSKTFLGVTVACARCHDHKFDAISTADYYSLSGFLQSSDYRQVRFESMEQNRRIAQQLATVDANYQNQILDLLDGLDIRMPSQTSYLNDDAIIVDYANIAQRKFLQDGFIFGLSPRQEGLAYWELETIGAKQENAPKSKRLQNPRVVIARHGSASSDPIWLGLESISQGLVQNKSALAKLPKSGRTLRSPTFELNDSKVSCLVDGVGHVVACVDSHRLVAGPLHKQTIQAIKANDRWVTLNLQRYIGHRVHLEFFPAQDSQLSVRMVTHGLGAEELAELDQRLAASDKQFKSYARDAEAVLNSGSVHIDERVFADFESGTYDGWTVTGEAFGTIPQTLKTIAPYQGRINGHGTYFVNSHNIRFGEDVGKGDSLTGTLTSPEFTIDFDTIEFLVGGGAHKGKTCVNLIVDGKVALSATGKRANRMSINTWNVRPFAGKKARIQLVDNHTAGWGNIGLDHIVFQKRAASRNVDSRQKNPPTATAPILDEARFNEASSQAHRIIQAWRREREQLSTQIVRKSHVALAMMDGTGEDDRILIRGNSSKPGDVEPRHFLTAVTGNSPMQIKSGSGRLELARQINDPSNPLTSRVIVNRIWHHLMGRGIVPTVDDFGFLGQRPTHPELLDHLASRFHADGRSIKKMIKYIVLSRTYQMSSRPNPGALETDPKNLLWHHRPPRRLQGEAIRDSLLALAGELDRTRFGPPVPIHLTSFMEGRGRPRNSGPIDGDGRRSIYIAIRRNFLSPFMLAFDTPVPFSSMGRRNVSNVPAQALILMNDPFVVQQANKWAQQAMQTKSNPTDRVDWMYQTAFARQPTDQERNAAVAYLKSHGKSDAGKEDETQRWADLAHALINTKEFIFLR